MTYETPRMLARTLLTLRRRTKVKGKKLSCEVFGQEVGRSRASVSAYETRQVSVNYELLDIYQFYFGAPNGLILCMSHVAAMARDATTEITASLRRRERRKLNLMGRYLRNLSDRILYTDGNVPLWKMPGIDLDNPESWDILLNEIFDSTQKGLAKNSSRLFKNLDRIDRIKSGHGRGGHLTSEKTRRPANYKASVPK